MLTRRTALAMLGALPAMSRATEGPVRSAKPRPLEEVFGAPSRGVITLPARRCLLDAPLVASRSAIRVRGVAGRTVLAIGSSPVLLSLADCSDVTFEDIAFESSFRDPGEFTYGLLTAADVHLRRIRFVRCTFSVPDVAINAIHLVFDHRGSAQSVHFEDCAILAAGRMGMEVQNHGNADPRYNDVRWTGGRIANTGLRSPTGMGLSLSGFGSECRIDTVFENNRYAAIEGVGVSASTFTGRFARQDRPVDILSFTGDRPMRDNVIRDCTTVGRANGNILLRNQHRLRMSNNDFTLTGGILCRDLTATMVKNDRYHTAGTSSLFLESTPTRTSSGNVWDKCVFDNGRAPNAFATLRFMGQGTSENIVEGTILFRGSGGIDMDNLGGAHSNVVRTLPVQRRNDVTLLSRV